MTHVGTVNVLFMTALTIMSGWGQEGPPGKDPHQTDDPLKQSGHRFFPVLAWIGPPPAETTLERYQELANAGFTWNMSRDPAFANLKEMDHAMEIAKQAGIKQYICVPELATDPEGTAKRYKDHPALAGYFLTDEPKADALPKLQALAKRIRSVDPVHGCYVNLNPIQAGGQGFGSYDEYVQHYAAEIPLDFISFDHYPIIGGNVSDIWYENLELIARKSKEFKKPMWAFALSTIHGGYAEPSVANLRLQVFSDLAYGAQCIQYFTYWTPFYDLFKVGPLTKDGKRSPIYDMVKQVNQEIDGLSGVFLGAEVVSVGHLGPLPRGAQAYKPEAPVTEVSTANAGAVVSHLVNQNRHFLVIVNRNLEKPMPVVVRLDDSAPVSMVSKTSKLTAVGREVKATIDAGDVLILTWK